jgi:hypothetical protein
MQPSIEDLAERINQALDALEGGRLTLHEAINLTGPCHRVVIPTDLFPNDEQFAERVKALLSVLTGLNLVLVQFRKLGIPPDTQFRQIPLLIGGIKRNIEAAREGEAVLFR